MMAGAVTGLATAQKPVVWWIVGYPFPAGPTVVCIIAVLITRLVIGLQATGKAQVMLDLAITALCVFVTVLWVQAHQLDLLKAGVTGIAVGATGAGVITIIKTVVMGRANDALNAFMASAPKKED